MHSGLNSDKDYQIKSKIQILDFVSSFWAMIIINWILLVHKIWKIGARNYQFPKIQQWWSMQFHIRPCRNYPFHHSTSQFITPLCNHWFRSVRKIYLFYILNHSTLKLKDELVGNWPIFVKGDGWWYKLFLPFVKKSCYSLEAALWGHNMASNKMTAHVTVLYE